MKKIIFSLLTFLSITAFGAGNMFEITITNITKNQIFAPPIVISHARDFHLFNLGEPSSAALSLMAEDGDTSMIYEDAMADGLVFDVTKADGPVMPGQSVTLEIDVNYLTSNITVAGMLVNTNDGFFAIDGAAVKIRYFKSAPQRNNALLAYVYDAGSEANTESCDHIPGPPCGSGGVRVTDGAEGYVYPHAGLHGGGDLMVSEYGWAGPVAKVEYRRVQ